MVKDRTGGKLDTIIGGETTLKGDCRVAGSLRLDGQVEGRMDVAEAFLTGPRSLLKGEVRCRAAVIAGRIEGNIFAGDTVELQAGAQVFGNITCRELVIQPGCFFDGNCSMRKTEETPPQL